MNPDTWHYHRTKLAKQILGMFESGLSSALTFFAPRRMGKTEFLRKDITPLAEKQHWQVFYFSFLDTGDKAPNDFTRALWLFTQKKRPLSAKAKNLFKKLSKVSGEAAGFKAEFAFNDNQGTPINLKETMADLADKKQVLLLLDEIQVLAQYPTHDHFVATLRTCLDMYKDNIKVIFTGSSQEGLRKMFSQAKAPFFHFGQNLPFPELDRGFTDHLAKRFETITKRKLPAELLWTAFEEMQKIPQLIRALVERLVLHPNLNLTTAKEQLLSEIFSDREFIIHWEQCSALERLILYEVAKGKIALFSADARNQLAKTLGVEMLNVPAIQSAVRVLQRKELLTKHAEHDGYFVNDLHFKNWLLQLMI